MKTFDPNDDFDTEPIEIENGFDEREYNDRQFEQAQELWLEEQEY